MKILFLFFILIGCTKKSHEELVGNHLPTTITKDLPSIVLEKNIISKAANSDYQKRLDTLIENEMSIVSELKLYQNGESFAPLLSMIENSQKYFYMNVLSFTCDAATERMVQLLERKAKAKVDVRLIVNKAFSYLSGSCLGRLEKSGVKIIRTKTHSSYFLNDQQELMIGSQSVARMFFLADGFNSLDRDMMLYTRGDLALDAHRDFVSIWLEEGDLDTKFQVTPKTKRAPFKADMACRFVSEKPRQGVRDIQILWQELVEVNQKELYFSGVKVETGEGKLGKLIKERSIAGVDTHYLGNGYLSGNGELTMVMNEWIRDYKTFAPILESINEWDKKRLARKNQDLYDSLKDKANINVWAYFNFIHYKVWLFDSPGFFVGSANLDESKFGEVYEAGVYCLDSTTHRELKAQLFRDQKNSVLYSRQIQK